MSQGSRATRIIKQSGMHGAILKLQKSVDETVVLLAEIKATSRAPKQQQRIGKLISDLQQASRELPHQDHLAVGIPKVFRLIKRAYGFVKTCF